MELNKIYTELFNEDIRLNTTKASSIEFLTTIHFIDQYVFPGTKILDIGAATGAYSLYYAKKGFHVTAVEPVKHNLDILKSKITTDMDIVPIMGNALDLSQLADNSI